MTEQVFKNTFAPNCVREEFTVDDIVKLITMGLKWDDIPDEIKPLVKPALDAYIERRKTKPSVNFDDPDVQAEYKKLRKQRAQNKSQ